MNTLRTDTPPAVIALISLLYLLAAVSTVIYADEFGYLGTALQFALFTTLCVGLWRLRKWARIAEILMCYVQLAGVLLLCAFIVLPQVQGPRNMDSDFIVLVIMAAVLNVLILWYMMLPAVKRRFQ